MKKKIICFTLICIITLQYFVPININASTTKNYSDKVSIKVNKATLKNNNFMEEFVSSYPYNRIDKTMYDKAGTIPHIDETDVNSRYNLLIETESRFNSNISYTVEGKIYKISDEKYTLQYLSNTGRISMNISEENGAKHQVGRLATYNSWFDESNELVLELNFNFNENGERWTETKRVGIVHKKGEVIGEKEGKLDFNITTNKEEYILNETVQANIAIKPKDIPISDVGTERKKEVAIIVDVSGSMKEETEVIKYKGTGQQTTCPKESKKHRCTHVIYKTRMEVAKEQANKLLDKLSNQSNIEVIVIPFSYYAQNKYDYNNYLDFNNNKTIAKAKEKINKLTPDGGTNIGDALRVGAGLFDKNSDSDKSIILFTDGEPTVHSYTSQKANSNGISCKSRNYYYNKINIFKDDDNVHWHTNESDKQDLEYSLLMSEAVRQKGIQTTVVGFSSGVSESTIGKITKALGGEYGMATNDEELEKIFNRFANSVDKTLNLTDVNVSIDLPEGLQYIGSSHGTAISKENNNLNIILPNITYTKNTFKGVYEANTINISMEMEVKNRTPEIKTIKGKINYKDFDGLAYEEYSNKDIKIVHKPKVDFLNFDINSQERVIKNSEFNVYNKIYPSAIAKGSLDSDDLNIHEDKLILKDVKMFIQIESNIEPINYEEYGYSVKNNTLEKTIPQIIYTLVGDKYIANPIEEVLTFKGRSNFIGKTNIQGTLNYGDTIKKNSIEIEFVNIEEINLLQSVDKTTLKKGDKVNVEYLVSGNTFELDGPETITLDNARVEIIVPNRLELIRDGEIYQVGDEYTLELGNITFTRNDLGHYIPNKILKDSLEFNVVTEKEGEILKLGATLKYTFNKEEKLRDFNNIELKISPGIPNLVLEMSNIGDMNGKYNLNIKSDVNCIADIDLYDKYGNLVQSLGRNIELKKNVGRDLTLNGVSGTYVRVKAINKLEGTELKAVSEETVPVINIEKMDFPSGEPVKNELNQYIRVGNMYILTDTGAKIDTIIINEKMYVDNDVTNGGIYTTKGTMFNDGDNHIKIQVSKGGNTSTVTFNRKVDAIPPDISINENGDSTNINISLNEPIKDNFILEVKGKDSVESYTKENLEKLGVLVDIENASNGIVSIEAIITSEWKGKSLTVYGEDLSGNIGKKLYEIKSNKEKEVTIDQKGIMVNGKYSNGKNVTVVKDMEIQIGVKLKIVFDGELQFDVLSANNDVEIKDIIVEDKNGQRIQVSSNNRVDFSKYYSDINGTDEFVFKFTTKVMKANKDKGYGNLRDIAINILGHEEAINKIIKLNILDIDLE